MKLETHLHTCESSPCGKLAASDMARRYAEAGYAAAVVADHINKNTPGAESFLAGFRAFRKAAKPLGLTALLGAEARLLDSGPHDFLIYGPRERDIPQLLDLLRTSPPVDAFSAAVRARGWLLIQAHPYRDAATRPIAPELLDGVEALNANPRHENFNHLAYAFAKAHSLIMTAGSDAHRVEDVALSGIEVPAAVRTIPALVAYLRQNPVPEFL